VGGGGGAKGGIALGERLVEVSAFFFFLLFPFLIHSDSENKTFMLTQSQETLVNRRLHRVVHGVHAPGCGLVCCLVRHLLRHQRMETHCWQRRCPVVAVAVAAGDGRGPIEWESMVVAVLVLHLDLLSNPQVTVQIRRRDHGRASGQVLAARGSGGEVLSTYG